MTASPAALLAKSLTCAAAVFLAVPAAAFGQTAGEGADGDGASKPDSEPNYVYSLDHGGSLGLSVGAFGNYSSSEKASCLTCETSAVATGWSGSLDIAASVGIGWEGAEFFVRFELQRLGQVPGENLSLGLRNYFGREEWKTFLDLEAVAAFRPVGGGGLRGGFGVIWDFHPLFGLWAEARAAIILGHGRTFGAQLGLGLQFRSYLFQSSQAH